MLKRDLYYERIPTKSLRDDVRYLGNILGNVIKQQEGINLFRLVEDIRRLSKANTANTIKKKSYKKLSNKIKNLSPINLFKLTRAFTHFMNFINIAESIDGARKLDEYENKNQICDVFFSMSHGVNRGKLKRDKEDERHNFITDLITQCPNIIFDIYGYKNREPVWAEDFYKVIVNSKMALNLTRGKPIKYLTSNRIASLIGNGLLTFIDKKTKLSNFFNKNEVIFYSNLQDLAEKINRFKGDDKLRMKVAKNGRKKYFELFECQKVSDYIISKSFNRETSKRLKWME